MSSYTWSNKVVIITGGANGIGENVVRALIPENVRHVAVLDVAEKDGIKLQDELNSKHGGDKVKFYKCDVTDDDQLFTAFNAVKSSKGYIDVVINNAGIMNDSLQVYKKEIAINFTALVTASLKALEFMRKDEGGRGGTIINVSSIAGLTKEPLMPIYWATKTAVIQFSNCLGHNDYFSKTGVRLLSICFGATSTSILTSEKLGSYEREQDSITLMEILNQYPLQSPGSAAQGLLDAYKKGETGSIWIVNTNKPAQDITPIFDRFYDELREIIFT